MNKNTFSGFLEVLRQDATVASWQIGYMRVVIDEPVVVEKIEESFSGFALKIANSAVTRSLALYCARAWDPAKDAISVPRLMTAIPATTENAAERSELLRDYSAVDQRLVSSLRVFRTERLAHRFLFSNDRQKLEPGQQADTTIREMLDIAEQTVGLVRRLGLVWDGVKSPDQDIFARSERYCREFWRVLPNLAEVEDQRVGQSVRG